MPTQDIQWIKGGKTHGVRWGDDGEIYRFEAGDDQATELAFRKAVRDGVLAGEAPSGEIARAAARKMAERVGVRKDASGDLIIAWFPFDGDQDEDDDLAQKLSSLGGGNISATDIHLTLVYLGDPEDYDLELVAAITKLHASRAQPVEGSIGGIGRFVGPDNQDIAVALIDSPGIDSMRRCLIDDLCCYGAFKDQMPNQGAMPFAEHGFVPHITLAYIPHGSAGPAPLDATLPFEIDQLTVAAGSSRAAYDIPDMDDMESEQPSVAYYASRLRSEIDSQVRKAGRVLSAANLAKIQEGIDAMQAVVDAAMARDAAQAGATADAAAAADGGKNAADAKKSDGSRGGLQDDGSLGNDSGAGQDAEGAADGEGLVYQITKASPEQRFTLGPLYAPNRKDAHGEWTDEETLQKAVWEYVRESAADGRRLNLQHGDEGDVTVGEWVEIMAWPYESTVKMAVPGEPEREVVLPAGTIYMGVIWDDQYWEEVKAKKRTGYSLGGKAVKVASPGIDLEHMGDKLS